jgi:hypothetical protein
MQGREALSGGPADIHSRARAALGRDEQSLARRFEDGRIRGDISCGVAYPLRCPEQRVLARRPASRLVEACDGGHEKVGLSGGLVLNCDGRSVPRSLAVPKCNGRKSGYRVSNRFADR